VGEAAKGSRKWGARTIPPARLWSSGRKVPLLAEGERRKGGDERWKEKGRSISFRELRRGMAKRTGVKERKENS